MAAESGLGAVSPAIRGTRMTVAPKTDAARKNVDNAIAAVRWLKVIALSIQVRLFVLRVLRGGRAVFAGSANDA